MWVWGLTPWLLGWLSCWLVGEIFPRINRGPNNTMDHYSSSSLSRIYNGNESAGPLSRVPPNSRLYPFCFINCFRSIQYSILPRVLHNVPSTCDIADLTSPIKLSERWARAFSCRAIVIRTSKGPLCYFAIVDFTCTSPILSQRWSTFRDITWNVVEKTWYYVEYFM